MNAQTTSSVNAPASINRVPGQTGSAKATGRPSAQARRKNRRRLEKELEQADRERRERAARNPPKPSEEPWVCEFCEYELIFREPPRALIRNFELKDRRHRQDEADRKRLLEKAKAKSRKGKKAAKAPPKSGQVVHHSAPGPAVPPGDGHEAPPMHAENSHSTQSDDPIYTYHYDKFGKEEEEAEGYTESLPDLARTPVDSGGTMRPRTRTK